MANYGCLITAVGRAKIANAILTGDPVVLTEMAVGDGAGNPVTPSPTQTALVREVYRRSINAMTLSPAAADTLLVEMVIPADVGPLVMRECGLFDQDGDLIAIANLPTSVKPGPDEGATKDVVITLTIKVDSAAAVTVSINPLLVIATRTWVDGNYLRLPGAGTAGQLLRKRTNALNDFEYFNPDFDATGFIFDCVEEPQTLAEDQTTVVFATISTAGIAVYLEKEAGGLERLIRDLHYTITDETTIELAAAYPVDTRLLGVQNDPNGAVTAHGVGALAINQNLADVDDKEAARGNLGLAYATQPEAEDGALLNRAMSPLRVVQLLFKRLATKAQAEAAESNEVWMSPLRVKQLIDVVIPRRKREREVGEIGMFHRKTLPLDAWLPLNGGTFGPPASGATVQQRDDCWDLYQLWWSDYTQLELPVTGGRGVSAAADWAAKKPMAIFNDADQFYRVTFGVGRSISSLQADAFQGHWHSAPRVATGGGADGITGGPTAPPTTSGPLTMRDPINDGAHGAPRVASETRPKNRAVLAAVHK